LWSEIKFSKRIYVYSKARFPNIQHG
jgi:hypothetical protein